MGIQETKNARVGIGVIVQNEQGQILLGKRNKSEKREEHKMNGEWDWSLPGGGLEYGESFEDCAIREVKEETNIDIQNPKFACVQNDCERFNNKECTCHWVTIGMMSTEFKGEAIANEPDKYTEWKWFELDKLPDNIFFPSAKVIAHLASKKATND